MNFFAPYVVTIIDDDEELLELIKSWISSNYGDKVKVESFVKGGVGKEFLEKNPAHIAFIDLHLDGEYGEYFVRDINKMGKGMKIAGMSADKSLTKALACFNAGADFFLDKPISKIQLYDIIDKCLEHFKFWNQIVESRSRNG